jgi:hypothetical protein
VGAAGFTDAMVAIEGENMRSVTWCVVEEVRSDWGIAGETLTTADVKNLAVGPRREVVRLDATGHSMMSPVQMEQRACM